MSADQLADAYVQGAADLRAAVTGMTREQFTARPVPGRMSTLEVLCHLADFEPVFAERMKRVIAFDNPPLLAADENVFLKVLCYQDRDAEEELTLIDVTRRQMARIIRTLTPEQLRRTGIHSEAGPLALETIIQKATNHIRHHLPYIIEKKKALGV